VQELERMRRVLAEKERAAAEAKRQQETLLAQELREARQRFEADLAAVQAQAQAQREDEAAALASVARKTHESPLHGLFEVDFCEISL
jgi:glutamine synthetase adenylyltransferase